MCDGFNKRFDSQSHSCQKSDQDQIFGRKSVLHKLKIELPTNDNLT